MFTAATAAASASRGSGGSSGSSSELRVKRNRFASHRSFSASDLQHAKRKQHKLQTANALDILSTYLAHTNSMPANDENDQRTMSITSMMEPNESSARRYSSTTNNNNNTNQRISTEGMSSRSGSPIDRDSCAAESFAANFAGRKSSAFLTISSSVDAAFRRAQLSAPNSPLQSCSSLTSTTTNVASAAAAGTESSVPILAADYSAWSEIARLSHHSDDLDDIDEHGHRCGHNRRPRYARQSSPFAAYIARKRFINAINRVRTESMVCTAMRSNADMENEYADARNRSSRPPSISIDKVEDDCESSLMPCLEHRKRWTLSQSNSENDDEKSNRSGNGGGEEEEANNDEHYNDATNQLSKLARQFGQQTSIDSRSTAVRDNRDERNRRETSPSLTPSSSRSRSRSRSPQPSSSSPSSSTIFFPNAQHQTQHQQTHQHHLDSICSPSDEPNGTWSPLLLTGRALRRSDNSISDSSHTNNSMNHNNDEYDDHHRYRSSSTSSITRFLNAPRNDSPQICGESFERKRERRRQSPARRSLHSFMALVRIKMFSVKRQKQRKQQEPQQSQQQPQQSQQQLP